MSKSIGEFLQTGDLSGVTTYQAGILQAASNRALQKACDDYLKTYGITKMQWLIVGSIYDARVTGGVRTTDLAKLLGTNVPYLTNSLNVLARRKIIAKREHGTDSRAKLIHLKPEFAKQVPTIEQGLRQALRDSIYKDVDFQEFRTYMKVMYQLSQV